MPLLIREVRPDDAQAILNILNPIIESGAYSALDTPFTVEAEQEFIHRFPQRGVFHLAEESREKRVVGFQTLEPFATYTRAFDHVGVVATFVELACRGRGVGRYLAKASFEQARTQRVREAIHFCTSRQSRCTAVLQQARLPGGRNGSEAGKIGGKYVDEVIVERFL